MSTMKLHSAIVPSADAPARVHHCGLTVIQPSALTVNGIATLGPPGTSSEAAGRYLSDVLDKSEPTSVTLFDTYEDAAAAVVAGSAGRLLVANAYHAISTFYMDPRFGLEQAFVFDTAHYGLAARPDEPLPLNVRAVTHPAPRDLIGQLIPAGYRIEAVETVASTSAAAAQVREGRADVALTTSTARRLYGLEFISPTRYIRMLWSVFVPSLGLTAPVHLLQEAGAHDQQDAT